MHNSIAIHQQTPPKAVVALPSKLQYSREEAAEMLGISERTLDRLIAEKLLIVRRIGRRVLVPSDALTSFTKRDHRLSGVN